ncbi:NAD(P)H-hydrate epimerase [Malonomonas rubra DSM 5091]|uniref:Bifunctional NAD(P)H-hydrate repair enzyme n=1 Tax=Malonomonas rubra DSM 5091 TaxID=1122189 RepID=A0A1M6F0Q6_MALRU|nr:bifunctional ADP-dependent NAD(P)H-hydrate dehydratase/NAD(P)H-hydrate epimerase [Malonomonas rubra]SHI91260.1 NAD(P)H-hydrate epimerase [Malonomonas rubra DSM 5091]
MRLIRAEEMVAVDQRAINQLGIPGAVLMENAGRAATDAFCAEFANCFPGPVLVLAGKGNNGGDGYVMARILADRGWRVQTTVLGKREDIAGDAAVMLSILEQLNVPIGYVADEAGLQFSLAAAEAKLIIDGLFGTGLKSDVRGLYATAIELVNASPAKVFAIDIPSGVDGSSGRICGMAVRADLTVTFDQAKIGHGSYPGAACVGRLEVVDIGIPQLGREKVTSDVRLVDVAEAARLLPERPVAGHKGRFGHLLIVAGAPGKTGAAALAGNAAVRGGSGLVTVAAPAAVHDILEVKLTEAMTCPLAHVDGFLATSAEEQILELLTEKQALAFGPGVGQGDDLRNLLTVLLPQVELPMVIDADGLNLLAGQLGILQERKGPWPVLTPHPGEMARLCGLSVAEIEAERFRVAKGFARAHNVVLLLKGARTVIAAPDGRVRINSSGNDGLASGGSGDVLTGLVGALLAQGLESFDAAILAAWLHGRAAELVAAGQGAAGMAASDLLCQLPVARRELSEGVCLC